MSGHRASRRRDYGRRQKDVRSRRAAPPAIDLDGPELWARARAWHLGPVRPAALSPSRSDQQPADEQSVGAGR